MIELRKRKVLQAETLRRRAGIARGGKARRHRKAIGKYRKLLPLALSYNASALSYKRHA